MSFAPTHPQPHPDQMARVEQLLEHFEQLEQQFQAVREGLTHSHRLATLGTVASIIAHEYNNILTPIISYAQLALAREADAPMMKKAVEKALAGAERAAKISSSLLGFAREADGEHAARLRPTIDEAVGCLAREPRKDGIELVIDVPDLQVAISPLNLQQVLLNLMLNSKKAMRRKGGQLRITAHAEGALVHIFVSDTGPGIPPAILERLFEPFATHHIEAPAPAPGTAGPGTAPGISEDSESFVTGRPFPDTSTLTAPASSLKPHPSPLKPQAFPPELPDSPERKGTGLGLCICRDLVRNAGGTIRLVPPAPVPGNGKKSAASGAASGNISGSTSGATFHITLPKADDLFETT